MFESIIEALRDIIGQPEFYVHSPGSMTQYMWDYGAMLEYCVAGILVIIVVGNVFKFLKLLIKK